MKYLAITSCLLAALVLLCGCGGGVGRTSAPPSAPPPQSVDIAGNWQISTSSTARGDPLGIAGSINQSGSAVSGTVHVFSFYDYCFDHLATVGLTGTLTGSNISLTSTSVAGVVISFDGSINNNTFTGTYALNGACTDQGNVTGIKIPTLANTWNGTFTTSGGETFAVAADVVQSGSASAEGSFGISGTATFHTPCFSSGTITYGIFPSGSFIIGNNVALEIETGNGTLAFLGAYNWTTGEIRGEYTVSGGTCDQTGTGILGSPSDY